MPGDVICFVGRPAAGDGPSNGMVVRHRSDNKLDDRACNLIYGTQKDNMQDAIRNGKIARGERHGSRRLRLDQVLLIKELLAQVSPVQSHW